MRGKSMRSGVATVAVTLAMTGVPGPAAAHDFLLVPNAFRVTLDCEGLLAGRDSVTAPGAGSARTDSSDVADAVNRYHHALETGDSAAALALLTDDAVILESGGMETRVEYRSHHLPSDIAFARAVKSVRVPGNVTVKGDVAWASSTSTTEGEFRGRPVNSAGAELMVLVRTDGGWKIAAIHWSARTRR
jgi:ketosteroid isomerase-like protein